MTLTDETSAPADPLLADLTEPQRQAVTHGDGPLLVLAAAGSGKTRVITRRIAYLVRGGVPPWEILALTFTNKAAAEMRTRVEALLGPMGGDANRATRGLTITTFHSLCARLLRRYADAIPGFSGRFTIYDAADQAALMKRVLGELQLSTSNWPPRSVLAAISHAKNALVDAERYAAQARDFYTRTTAKAYAAYQRALRDAHAVDFDDLLVLTASLLGGNEHVRGECRACWRNLLIDEYQDTNRAQLEIARLLAGGADADGAGPNICVVGDPDQAIYGWRGADIANILDFEEHYPSARVIALGENFRSTAPILAAADALIRRNAQRRHKPLFTNRPGGDKVRVVLCRDEQHEAALVVDWFRSMHDGGAAPWRDMAVFYRTNALSRVIEDALRQAGVPYVIARGTAFYEREEVRDAIAYLRVIANPADGVSLERIANTPARGISDATLDRLGAFARAEGVPVFGAMRRAAETPGVAPRAAAAVAKFVALIDSWADAGAFMGADSGGSLAELVARVIRESGLERMYDERARASGSDADAERLDNIAELVSSASQFELEYDPASDPASEARGPAAGEVNGAPSGGGPAPRLALLRAYLESISLVADADTLDPAQGAVSLMTLHAAKGLEFPAVAIIGLEDGTLPHARADDSEADLEEERRLMFVGITRAMRALTITSAAVRTIRGLVERTIPSRFLDEIDPAHSIVSDQSDVLSGIDAPSFADRAGRGPRGDPGPAARFPAGTRVRHPQFGLGEVIAVTAGINAKAQVRFRDVGVKTLVLEYARLKKL